jgi:hypothetical protein
MLFSEALGASSTKEYKEQYPFVPSMVYDAIGFKYNNNDHFKWVPLSSPPPEVELEFELRAYVCKAGPLLLEPHLQHILLPLFWRWGVFQTITGLEP